MRRVRAFALGLVGGALVDQIHVQFGVLAYRRPRIAGQAWWVGPQFGVAAIGMVDGAAWVAAQVDDDPDVRTATAWFLAAYLASGVLRKWPRALATAYVAMWLLRMAGARSRFAMTAWSLALAAIGTSYESALSSTGAFWYTDPDVARVPVWLPGLYLHGAPLAVSVARRLG